MTAPETRPQGAQRPDHTPDHTQPGSGTHPTHSTSLPASGSAPVVLFAADVVALAHGDLTGQLVRVSPAEARRLAADLLDAAVRAETAPPHVQTLHTVGGRS